MSDQGPVPDWRADDFGLIETLLWTEADGFALLPEHLARLAASSAALGFRYDAEEIRAALGAAVAPPPHPSPASREREQSVALTRDADRERPLSGASGGGTGRGRRLRIRLVLSRDGAIETAATPIDPVPPETVWRVALAERRFSSADPMLRHKTTRRALYEDALADAQKRLGADEVLFLNERDEFCESARCTLFIPKGDILLTPPLSCGLLPGTLRAHLIASGRAQEAVLRLPDAPPEFRLGNSVRGLVRARLMA
jgi:branched-subunit amino acid aminotransferase/4-amino-4-deoxychorismate lyase